ncbi:MAG TPA: zinc dependent phospholipase C family protein [Candidatus Baltobacteraceae bacterium]|nr:zinc dependent phospholipase C family protein [Candidatus Baltobacteraceae bacterium]
MSRRARKGKISHWYRASSAALVLLLFTEILLPPTGFGYAVLAHQALIDTTWESHVKPLLKTRYPEATEEQLSAAQAYAYGGSIIQDLGYYPHGSHFFSDLTHYVRSGDFVLALLRDAQNVYDYAFALGALSHYATDNQGHRLATNRAVPILYPKLKSKFGDFVTYEDDTLAHVKTEFGFDVLQVAKGQYASESYHDFIGFEVSRPLLDQAFQQVYGVELISVLDDEEKALNSYRRDVSKLIPEATRIAWSLKGKEIQADEPGATHRKFLFNLSRSEYEKQWGKDYQRPSRKERFYAFLYKLLPKIGPLKVLQLKTPTPETEKLFEESFNASVQEYQKLLSDERKGTLQLANLNFDVGSETSGGKYRLNDDAHAQLLHRLAEKKFGCVSPDLREEILGFFASADAPYDGKQDKKTWDRVQAELESLKEMEPGGAPAHPITSGLPAGVKACAD